MINRLVLPVLFVLFVISPLLSQQKKDKAQFKEYKNVFFDSIRTSAEKYNEEEEESKIKFMMDFSGYDLPNSIDQFSQLWYNSPVSQGWTGTCWSFSTTSYFESEIYRVTNQKLKLSEMFTVYWEYIEKARRFVRERGSSVFDEGSEANAVIRIWKMYGIVPEKEYPGKPEGQEFFDHHLMIKEMNHYLTSMKEMNAWNEEEIITTIKSILNHYMGVPPEIIEVDGKKFTPKDYLKNYVKLNLDNYVDFMSLMEKPYNRFVEYVVRDNWWHSEEYYNLPLNDFMKLLKTAVRHGYTLAIGGDVSEAGYDALHEVAVVPTFDIPAEFIDENARQFRFSNNSTQDDHGIHIVGYMEKDGKDWYLIKDSGSGSRNGNNKGFYFYHEDYVKLKIMNIMLPKDFAEKVLATKLN
jgi:bleomycin hydrolase